MKQLVLVSSVMMMLLLCGALFPPPSQEFSGWLSGRPILQPEKFFDAQVQTLVQKGYPRKIGMTKKEFINYLAPLKDQIGGKENFFVIIPESVLPIEQKLSLLTKWDKANQWWQQNFPPATDQHQDPYLIDNIKACCDLDLNLTANEAVMILTYCPTVWFAAKSAEIVGDGWVLKKTQYGPMFEGKKLASN